jgi:hypothetical protein
VRDAAIPDVHYGLIYYLISFDQVGHWFYDMLSLFCINILVALLLISFNCDVSLVFGALR